MYVPALWTNVTHEWATSYSILKATNQKQENNIFRFGGIKAPYTPKIHSVQRRLLKRTRCPVNSIVFLANMKSIIAVCVVAVAITTFTIPAEAQSSSAPSSQPGLITSFTLPPTESPSRMPPPKHGCNCKETCEAVQHSQVPYKKNNVSLPKITMFKN